MCLIFCSLTMKAYKDKNRYKDKNQSQISIINYRFPRTTLGKKILRNQFGMREEQPLYTFIRREYSTGNGEFTNLWEGLKEPSPIGLPEDL